MKLSSLDFGRLCSIGIFCALLLLALYLGMRFLFPVLLPFLLAWGAALLLRPVNLYLHRKTRLPLRAVSAITILMLLLLCFGILFGLIFRLVAEVRGLAAMLAEEPGLLEDFFGRLGGWLPGGDGEGAVSGLREYTEALVGHTVDALMAAVPSVIGSAVLTLPGVVLFLLVSVVAAFYFSMDLDAVNAAVRRCLPRAVEGRLGEWRQGALRIAGGYLRAYLILTGVIFLLMLLGLSFLGVRYALLLAVVLSALDILPVIGVGTVLVPWGIVCLIGGNPPLGIGLLVLFGVSEIVRQVLEPRLLGSTLGVHPLLSLFSLYFGARLFGLFGIVLGPCLAVLLRALWRYLPGENKKPVT